MATRKYNMKPKSKRNKGRKTKQRGGCTDGMCMSGGSYIKKMTGGSYIKKMTGGSYIKKMTGGSSYKKKNSP